MTKEDMAKLPPMPFQLIEAGTVTANGSWHLYLCDANGRQIAALWGKSEEKQALGVFIVEASEKASQP